jgi:DNA-binding GntR family transcriptional regulator
MTPDTSAKRSPLEVHRTQSLTSLVQQEIERMILRSELKPGERVNEHVLAESFSVSRGPIREALRGLEKAGLVKVIANRGSFVREVSAEEALEIQELRTLLLSHAAQRLAKAVTPAQSDTLHDLLGRIDEAERAGDRKAFYPLNLAFHETIVSFSDNARLTAIYASLSKEGQLFRHRHPITDFNVANANAEHRGIVEAIVAGDGDEARRRAEAHMRIGERLVREVMRRSS